MQHNHHTHEHQEFHHHDTAQANRDYFDKTAKDFDTIPFAVFRGERYVDQNVSANRKLAETKGVFRSAEAIRKEYPFDKDVTTMMEYACGTGI